VEKYGKLKNTGKKLREKSTEKYGKIRKKSTGKGHLTSGDVTSGQACAMVRSSESSANAN
jgi:hypothetical protein